MASYALTCCSTADLTHEQFVARDIQYVCFHFTMNGETYPDDLGQSMPFPIFYQAMANDIWASTFHSACVRILRRDIDRIGFDKDFTIYDTDDSKRVIKDILKELNLDEKTFQPKSILSIISSSKDKYESPEEFAAKHNNEMDWKMARIAKVYAQYTQKLRAANALDFDDIIYHTVTLLQQEREVREYYQQKFRYVLVDEYQDTNHMQYLLTSLLAGGRKNLCVVGDGDPLPFFRGEPKCVLVGNQPIEEYAESLWQSLNEQNKISLFVRYIDAATGETETVIKNKHVK